MSVLGIINLLLPKDRASSKRASAVAYGQGERHKLDIYGPAKASGPLPVVVFIYGGSWCDGSRRDYDFVGRALAAQGYVTVIADYRLLPEVEYPAFLADCAQALAWLVDNIAAFGGDAERIGLMGHSAGAYNAVMLALDPAYGRRMGLLGRVKCVVGLSGPYDFFPFDGPISLRTFGAVRDPRSTQPINLVTADAPPMFLGTGDKDRLVYPRNSVALAARLRSAGVQVEERHYENLGHPGTLLAMASLGRGFAPVLQDVAGFLKAHLQSP